MSPIQPLNGHIVIRPLQESEKKIGNIYLADIAEERPELGEVIATSDVFNYNTGQYVPCEVAVGDTVIIPKLGTVKMPHDGEDYYITKSTEILGKLQ